MATKKENENEENGFIIEDAFARLEEIGSLLEDPNTNLKEALSLYTEGVKLVSLCKANLEDVEKEIQILDEV